MSRESGEEALSFLDVITNGLGGILLLFFIMMAFRTGLRSVQGPPDPQAPAAAHRKAPFLVIVSAPPRTALLRGRLEDPWLVRAAPAWRVQTSAGANYALLASDEPPPPAASVHLGPLEPGTPISVQVFHAGRRVLAHQDILPEKLPGADGVVRLWPLPGREGKP